MIIIYINKIIKTTLNNLHYTNCIVYYKIKSLNGNYCTNTLIYETLDVISNTTFLQILLYRFIFTKQSLSINGKACNKKLTYNI